MTQFGTAMKLISTVEDHAIFVRLAQIVKLIPIVVRVVTASYVTVVSVNVSLNLLSQRSIEKG